MTEHIAIADKDEWIGGPMGSCVAIPALRHFSRRERFPFDHGDLIGSPAYRSAYLHAVETAMKAIEAQKIQTDRPPKPQTPQTPPGRIIRG